LDWLGPFAWIAASITGGIAWLFMPVGFAALFCRILPCAPVKSPSHDPSYALTAAIAILSFVPALALHELGHYAVARKLDARVRAIGLGPFEWVLHHQGVRWTSPRLSGFLELEADLTRWEEAWITAAGPISNLAACMIILAPLTQFSGGVLAEALMSWAMANASVGVTNLMPFRIDDTVSDGERLLAIFFQDR